MVRVEGMSILNLWLLLENLLTEMHYANISLELFYFAEVVVCHSQIRSPLMVVFGTWKLCLVNFERTFCSPGILPDETFNFCKQSVLSYFERDRK
jgi:hypothetical protein